MKQRVITATILCTILIPMLLMGSYFVVALVMFLSFRGVYELIRMHNQKHKLSNGYKYVLPVVSSLLSGLIGTAFLEKVELIPFVVLPILIFVFVTLLIVATFDKKINVFDMMSMIFYMIYGGLSFSLLAGIRFINNIDGVEWKIEFEKFDINLIGLSLIGYSLIVSSTTDVGAQLGGMAFGKHKLCPTISPKKTIEGFISGLLVGGTLGTVTLCLCQHFGGFNILGTDKLYINIPVIFMISVLLSLAGQIGDLVASKIKRENGIKDYGRIFPGHGGVLDRFDSSIAVTLLLFSIMLIVAACFGEILW